MPKTVQIDADGHARVSHVAEHFGFTQERAASLLVRAATDKRIRQLAAETAERFKTPPTPGAPSETEPVTTGSITTLGEPESRKPLLLQPSERFMNTAGADPGARRTRPDLLPPSEEFKRKLDLDPRPEPSVDPVTSVQRFETIDALELGKIITHVKKTNAAARKAEDGAEGDRQELEAFDEDDEFGNHQDDERSPGDSGSVTPPAPRGDRAVRDAAALLADLGPPVLDVRTGPHSPEPDTHRNPQR